MKKSTIALIVAAVVCLGLSAFSAKASVTRTNEAIEEIGEEMCIRDSTDGDGIANVSEYYNEKHDRKVVEDSWNIIDLVKHPNKFLAIIAGIFVLVIVLIILLILLVKKIVRKIKTN